MPTVHMASQFLIKTHCLRRATSPAIHLFTSLSFYSSHTVPCYRSTDRFISNMKKNAYCRKTLSLLQSTSLTEKLFSELHGGSLISFLQAEFAVFIFFCYAEKGKSPKSSQEKQSDHLKHNFRCRQWTCCSVRSNNQTIKHQTAVEGLFPTHYFTMIEIHMLFQGTNHTIIPQISKIPVMYIIFLFLYIVLAQGNMKHEDESIRKLVYQTNSWGLGVGRWEKKYPI